MYFKEFFIIETIYNILAFKVSNQEKQKLAYADTD